MLEPRGKSFLTPGLTTDAFVTSDGLALPLRTWRPEQGNAKAVVFALHGFNDYSNAFDRAARIWASHGVITYAYDQRGFGRAPHVGRWSGVDAMVEDAQEFSALLRQRHSNVPLVAVGLSMGAAVLMAAETRRPVEADRLVLAAPAVWGRAHMPWYQRAALEAAAFFAPWLPLTGRGLKKRPSDNIEMLRSLGRDPFVIKETRADAVWGLVNLMDAAQNAASSISRSTLVLYGAKEDLIPEAAWRPTVDAMTAQEGVIVKVYLDGHHMLLRDLNADRAINDVGAFILTGARPAND